MKTQSVTVDSVAISPWLWVDSRRYTEQQISVNATISAGATLTYTIQYTMDDNTKERWRNASVSTSPPVSTVTLVDHGLRAGDNLVVFDSGYVNHSPDPGIETQVNSVTLVDADTVTYTSTGAAGVKKVRTIAFSPFDHPTLSGETTTQVGSFNVSSTNGVPLPINGVRIRVTAHTDGEVTLKVLQQG